MSLMILGTSSHAGKTTIVTAVCRCLSNRGLKVAPFKSQNMSLNSYITPDGKEIAISQAVQSFAAKITPNADTNPILLKPKGNSTSQIILFGEPYKDAKIADYYKETDYLLEKAVEAYRRLEKEYGNIVVEGAGGAAEVNLYSRDIANILLAKKLQIPIVIVGDIERGGIFAQLIGTYDLLPDEVRKNVCGFIVNKFRGDSELFREGVRIIEEKTGVDVLGVIPYTDTELPSEDSLSLYDKRSRDFPVKIAVMKIFGLSNFNDFELLERYACLDYVTPGTSLKDYDCIIIPGTKNTVEALLELKSHGFADEIADARRRKIPIIGICGGYQMLCRKIHDEGIESGSKADYEGFGLFDAVTTFAEYKKTTVQVTRKVNPVGEILSGADTVSGYEIHMGQTDTGSEEKALEGEGCVSADGLVIGTYMHGLFSNANISQSLLKYLYSQKGLTFAGIKEEDIGYDKALNELAQHFEANTDFEKILAHFDTTRIRTD